MINSPFICAIEIALVVFLSFHGHKARSCGPKRPHGFFRVIKVGNQIGYVCKILFDGCSAAAWQILLGGCSAKFTHQACSVGLVV